MPIINHTFFDLWTAIIYKDAFKRLFDCNYLHTRIQLLQEIAHPLSQLSFTT